MEGNRKYYPLTHPQMGIWYTEKLYPGTSIGVISATLKISGDINYVLLEKAINKFIQMNDGVRLRVLEEEGRSYQYIHPYTYQEIDFIDFSDYGIEELYNWDIKQTEKAFDLIDHDLYYFSIFKLDNKNGGFFIKTHHLISDAWSLVLLGNQIIRNYNSLLCNLEIDYTEGASYLNYIENEKSYIDSVRFIKDREYWNNKFKDFFEYTSLKTYKSVDAGIKAKRKTYLIPEKLSLKLWNFCKENKTSPFTLFLAALSIYCQRVLGKDDVTFGSPILNRSNALEKETFGMFISTIPLRIKMDNDMDFITFLHNISKEWMENLRHQKYPNDFLMSDLRSSNKDIENLYDIILSYQNAKVNKQYENVFYESRWHFNQCQRHSLYIHINDRDGRGDLILDYDYLENVFQTKEIEFIHDHIIRILWHALDNPLKSVSKIDMISEKEKDQILNNFNRTRMDFPDGLTLNSIFEAQVGKTPDRTAIIFESERLTYRELNEKANQVANIIRQEGVIKNDVVGILINRSLELVIGIFAVLKAGAGFLLIDHELPQDRVNFILQNSNSKLLITHSSFKEKDFSARAMYIDELKFSESDTLNPTRINNSSDLAYVIYTSGSTGNPKGVMIEHGSIINFTYGVSRIMDFSEGVTVLSMTNVSFDVFIFEIIPSLILGLEVILANDTQQKIPTQIGRLIEKYRIKKLHSTPSKLQMLVDNDECRRSLKYVKEIIVGGEVFSNKLLEKVKNATLSKVFNGYGPSETTVGVTFKDITNSKLINIGKPIANTNIYILDKRLNIMPIGIPGELYISGKSVGRGYLNNPELTSERFVINPFNPDELMYRTGDLARWYPKGEIQFIGRMDHQVKIRGYRIELAEIESQLMKCQGLREVIVIDRMYENGDKYLCAYIVADSDIKIEDIKSSISKHLPYYMIPSYFIKLVEMPLSKSGKIDRTKLPEPDFNSLSTSKKELPRNKVERKLVKIWSDILHMQQIGITDNFFELGADSVDVISFLTKAQKEFGIELPMTQIYESPTIKEISRFFKVYNKIEMGSHDDEIVLMKKGKGENLFLIHAGSGNVGVYVELCKRIKNGFNCWGIQMKKRNHYAPVNISIEEIAKDYIQKVKKICPEGPYYFAGWCIGGTIAFEMASQLERMGEQVNFVGLFNSIAPRNWDNIMPFSPATELLIVKSWFNNCDDVDGLGKLDSIEILWDKIIASIQEGKVDQTRVYEMITEDMKKAIPNYNGIDLVQRLYYISTIRTLHNARANYFPGTELKSNVCFFNALNDNIILEKEYNIGLWRQYCENGLIVYPIESDHYNMFGLPQVKSFSNILNKAIKECDMESEEICS